MHLRWSITKPYLVILVGGPDMAPKPPNVRTGPGNPGRSSVLLGAPDMAPNPPAFGPARETRGAPLSCWEPRDGPQTPNVRTTPGNPGRSSVLLGAPIWP